MYLALIILLLSCTSQWSLEGKDVELRPDCNIVVSVSLVDLVVFNMKIAPTLLVANLANTKCCKNLKMTETLAYWYSSKSSARAIL